MQASGQPPRSVSCCSSADSASVWPCTDGAVSRSTPKGWGALPSESGAPQRAPLPCRLLRLGRDDSLGPERPGEACKEHPEALLWRARDREWRCRECVPPASDGVVTPYPKTARSRRRVPLTTRALLALDALPPRLDTPLLFPAPSGGLLWLDNWRTREWYDALDAAGIARRGPYHLRHTFASEALAAGVSIFELSRLMGASVREIDRTYGHLVRDSEDAIRARLEARADRSGVVLASGGSGSSSV